MLKIVYFLLSICVVSNLSASTSATHPAYDFSTDLQDDLGSTKPTTKDTTQPPQKIRYPKDTGAITDDLGVAPPLKIATNPKPQGAASGGLEKPSDLKVGPHGNISPEVIYPKPSEFQPSYTFYDSISPSYFPTQSPYEPSYYELPPLHMLQSPQVIHYYHEVVVTTFFIHYMLPIVHYIAQNPYPPRFCHYEAVQSPIYRWPVYVVKWDRVNTLAFRRTL